MKIEEFETVAEFVEAYNAQFRVMLGVELLLSEANDLICDARRRLARGEREPVAFAFMAFVSLPRLERARVEYAAFDLYGNSDDLYLVFPSAGVLRGVRIGTAYTALYDVEGGNEEGDD